MVTSTEQSLLSLNFGNWCGWPRGHLEVTRFNAQQEFHWFNSMYWAPTIHAKLCLIMRTNSEQDRQSLGHHDIYNFVTVCVNCAVQTVLQMAEADRGRGGQRKVYALTDYPGLQQDSPPFLGAEESQEGKKWTKKCDKATPSLRFKCQVLVSCGLCILFWLLTSYQKLSSQQLPWWSSG